jgi:putative flippase GtrA
VVYPPDRFGIGINGRALVISPKVRRFALYTFVNVVAGWVDFASFLVLTHLYGLPTLQSVFSYSLSMLVNFQLQRDFVFVGGMSYKSEFRVFMQFVGTGMLGLASTACVIWFTTHILSFSPVVAKTIAMLICFVVLYVARSRFVFNENASPVYPAAAQSISADENNVFASIISTLSACFASVRSFAVGALNDDFLPSSVLCFSVLASSGAF